MLLHLIKYFVLASRICQKSLDDDQKVKYYCVYFDESRYWGRLLKIFSDDVDDSAKSVEMKFLHYTCGSWVFPKVDDTKIVNVKYVFMGPCTATDITKKGYKFSEDDMALAKYKGIKIKNVTYRTSLVH